MPVHLRWWVDWDKTDLNELILGKKGYKTMKKLSDRQKTLIKWLCVLVLVGLIIYVFRDMAGPILSQLVKTSPVVVAAILGATLLYGVIESCITFILMRQVENDMTFFDANIMTYFVSFYRVSTLGSGTIVASTLFMKHCGIQPSKALGLYSIDYAIHKMTICVMAVALFLANREYMLGVFGKYSSYVVLGVIATILITMAIVLFACWPPFHRFLRWLLEKADALFKGRFAKLINSLSEQTAMMEDATRVVLKKPWLIVVVMLLDICKFSCWFSIPYIVCHNVCDMNIITSIGITAMSVMLAAVIPMPGGIGSSELVMTAIYSGLVGAAAAGAMALLYRFATFMFPFIIGAFTAIFFKRFKRYKAAQNEKQGIPDGDSMADTDS